MAGVGGRKMTFSWPLDREGSRYDLVTDFCMAAAYLKFWSSTMQKRWLCNIRSAPNQSPSDPGGRCDGVLWMLLRCIIDQNVQPAIRGNGLIDTSNTECLVDATPA